MSEELYKELQKVYTKEAFANMIKTDIHQRLPEPYVCKYILQTVWWFQKCCRFLWICSKINEKIKFIKRIVLIEDMDFIIENVQIKQDTSSTVKVVGYHIVKKF